MNTQMILNELSLIFQEILKRDNIVLPVKPLPRMWKVGIH